MAWRGSGVRIPSAPQSSRRAEAVPDSSLMVAVQLGEGLHRASAEYAALDFAAVVLERVVQVHGGGLGGCFGLPVPDGAVDRLVFADGGVGVPAQPAQADDAGPALQHAGLANGGDEEEVVRGGGDAEVEGVIALVELRVVAAGVTVAAGLHRGFDHP